MSVALEIGNSELRLKDFLVAAKSKSTPRAELAPQARDKMATSRSFIEHICREAKPVYGVNTGVGHLSNTQIDEKDLATLQGNIIRSHCVGVGTPLKKAEARLLMLLRAHTLALGYSGVRSQVVESILQFVNHDIIPIIPSEGSVGASGDLAPLAHLALCLLGEGEVSYRGQKLRSSLVLKEVGLEPLELEAKEGLSLINGTQLMMVYGILCLAKIQRISKVADVIAACSLECIRGSSKPFDSRIHEIRPHPGQQMVADNIRRLITDSKIMESHKDCGKVQDSYSFRCVPQVHGASRDYIASIATIINRELHAVTDNPIVFGDAKDVISAGNFHGAPLALGLDMLAICVSEIGAIAERRLDKLTNPVFSDLSAFLAKNPGLNSGVMLAQYTAAALASENKVLCHPSSVDSIPTSADKEDHVSMGPAAGKKLKKVILNTQRILSIEALCARQGLWHLEPTKPGKGVQEAYKMFSQVMPPIENDRVLADDIFNMHKLLFKSNFVEQIEDTIGGLN